MREINFRAWDEKEKKMWNKNHVVCGDGVLLYGGHNIETLVHTYTLRNDLIPLQYTGLKDKNGKEIYEGDVVKWDGFYVRDTMVTDKFFGTREMQPVQVDKSGMSAVEFKDARFRIEPLHLEPCEYEVIGNIYENPDLLKV